MRSIEMPDFLNIYLILLGWDNPDAHMNSPWRSLLLFINDRLEQILRQLSKGTGEASATHGTILDLIIGL